MLARIAKALTELVKYLTLHQKHILVQLVRDMDKLLHRSASQQNISVELQNPGCVHLAAELEDTLQPLFRRYFGDDRNSLRSDRGLGQSPAQRERPFAGFADNN